MIVNNFSRTKIVATVGPSSSDNNVMLAMVNAGVDVFRLNFSHSTREEHKTTIEKIRNLNKEHGAHVGILCDLQGPKLRIGVMKNGSELWEKEHQQWKKDGLI